MARKANVKTKPKAKTSNSRSSNTKSKPKTKKAQKSQEQKNEEIAGVAICAVGIFMIVCLFASASSGAWGVAIKNVMLGSLGSFGFILPIGIIAIGIVLISKGELGISKLQIAMWVLFGLSIMCVYHMLFTKEILSISASDIDFQEMKFTTFVTYGYQYGMAKGLSFGALGSIITFLLVKYIGTAGSYILFITYIGIVIVIKSRMSLREVSHEVGEKINESAKIVHTNFQDRKIERQARNNLYIEDLHTPGEDRKNSRRSGIDLDKFIEPPEPIPDFLSNENQLLNSTSMDSFDDIVGDTQRELPNISLPGDGKKGSVDEGKWDSALNEAHKDDLIKPSAKDNDSVDLEKHYTFPDISLLTPNTEQQDGNLRAECHSKAIKLEETLRSFKVDAKVINITCGPTVTRFELKPAPGIKVAKISNLSNDIALSLAAEGVRIEAPIPGKSAVGIEIPNKIRATVKLRDIIDGSTFRKAKSPVSICIGKDITGKNVVADLSKMPHMLVAGATGSGKSVFINSLIVSLIYKSPPADVRMIMIDPKKVELNVYNGIPHLLIPVVSNPNKAAGALNWAVKEMTQRYDKFSRLKVRNLDGYNLLADQEEDLEKMPRIVIIIDELADLMQVVASEVEGSICRLAQLARAAGMHLVIATQRPDVRVITGNIKANIPCRVAFMVNQYVDSKTILDGSGAEKLMPRGDMLFKPGGAPKPLRLQGAFVSDEEVEAICETIRVNEEFYDNNVMDGVEEMANKTVGSGSSDHGLGEDFDMLVGEAVKVIYEHETASTSMVQRKLRVGYNRAARIMDDMERLNIVGPLEGSKPREILMTQGHAMELISGSKKYE